MEKRTYLRIAKLLFAESRNGCGKAMKINDICIQMLPAGSGDCIYIEFTNANFRMLIDGGYVKTYQDFLKNFLIKLKKDGKRLNLVIVTHVDDDHINGIKALLRENGTSENPNIIGINEIWFNGLKQCIANRKMEQKMDLQTEIVLEDMAPEIIIMQDENREENISYVSGSDLTELIQSGKYAWNFSVENGMVTNNQVVKFGDVKIMILNPKPEILTRMGESWIKELKDKLRKVDVSQNKLYDAAFEGFYLNEEPDLDVYEENISYTDAETDWTKQYIENRKKEEVDPKLTNCSSIAFLIEYKGLELLFPGDCPIQYFEDKLPDEIEVIKLPHHGSAKNISVEFIKNKKVKYYLLSTDGTKHNHPAKSVIGNIIANSALTAKLIKNYEIKWLKGVGSVDESYK